MADTPNPGSTFDIGICVCGHPKLEHDTTGTGRCCADPYESIKPPCPCARYAPVGGAS